LADQKAQDRDKSARAGEDAEDEVERNLTITEDAETPVGQPARN